MTCSGRQGRRWSPAATPASAARCAVAFAKEGADVALAYLCEDATPSTRRRLVRAQGRRCLILRGDLGDAAALPDVVATGPSRSSAGSTSLVNNVATQQPVDAPEEIDDEQWLRTFDVNVHSYFRVTKAALPHLGHGAAIINTGSINGLRGNKTLIDYSATKGAVTSLTYSLAQSLMDRGIRVNCVAPGPVWTPLIPATMPAGEGRGVRAAGADGAARRSPTRSRRPTCSSPRDQLSSYYTGEVLAPVGGETLPGVRHGRSRPCSVARPPRHLPCGQSGVAIARRGRAGCTAPPTPSTHCSRSHPISALGPADRSSSVCREARVSASSLSLTLSC